jgi:hypothetical protein
MGCTSTAEARKRDGEDGATQLSDETHTTLRSSLSGASKKASNPLRRVELRLDEADEAKSDTGPRIEYGNGKRIRGSERSSRSPSLKSGASSCSAPRMEQEEDQELELDKVNLKNYQGDGKRARRINTWIEHTKSYQLVKFSNVPTTSRRRLSCPDKNSSPNDPSLLKEVPIGEVVQDVDDEFSSTSLLHVNSSSCEMPRRKSASSPLTVPRLQDQSNSEDLPSDTDSVGAQAGDDDE